jgi:hypothetical protein
VRSAADRLYYTASANDYSSPIALLALQLSTNSSVGQSAAASPRWRQHVGLVPGSCSRLGTVH